jgi:integrase
VTAALRDLLEEQDRCRKELERARGIITPWVFYRMVAERRAGPKFPKPITVFNKAWSNACGAAGCPGRIPHDLRRTAVRSLVRASVPERVAMQLTGHKTRSMLERYTIVSDSDLTAAARRLDEVAGIASGIVEQSDGTDGGPTVRITE